MPIQARAGRLTANLLFAQVRLQPLPDSPIRAVRLRSICRNAIADGGERQMKSPVGRTIWAIAEGYIPAASTGPEPQMTSHETACLLNAGDRDAHVQITILFSDREPAGPYRVRVPARRTLH